MSIETYTRNPSAKTAIEAVLKVEGGYVNDPKDRGGETNWGVTAKTARANGYHGPMRALTRDEAIAIYKRGYWDTVKGDEMIKYHPFLAYHLFDFGVNAGPVRANTHLQIALNALNRNGRDYPDIGVDGMIGKKTFAALNSYVAKRGKVGVVVLINAIISLQANHYLNLINQSPSQEEFAFGWLSRASEKFNAFNDMQ